LLIAVINYDQKVEIPMTTKVLTAHIHLSFAEKVDQLAARLERSRGWIIKQAAARIFQFDEYVPVSAADVL
jgi:predicted transcriptional regulator